MPRRIMEGVVVSTKSANTAVVKIERTFLHPQMRKTVRQTKKYHAHDPSGVAKDGAIVQIRECTPISKLKRWEVVTPEIAEEIAANKKARSAAEAADGGAA